jgi:undecaprenyl diphosphate synthase
MKKDLPRHIAIIMDGNGRWAGGRGLPRIEGHRAGVGAVRAVTEECARLGVPWLTLFAFSRENWKRPAPEVRALMQLLARFLRGELPTLMKNRIRLRSIGAREDLPPSARRALAEVEEATAGNRGMTLVLALSYSGREDVLFAARRAMELAREGKLAPGALDERTFSSLLWTDGIPDPDLLIRTSGEMRLSNFLAWQTVYSEMVVTDVLWPDFGAAELARALDEYAGRERRFGLTSAQARREKARWGRAASRPSSSAPRW